MAKGSGMGQGPAQFEFQTVVITPQRAQLPHATRKKYDLTTETVEHQRAPRAVGHHQRPEEPASSQPQGIELEGEIFERDGIERTLGVFDEKLRAAWRSRALQMKVIRHHAAIPAQAQPAEFHLQP